MKPNFSGLLGGMALATGLGASAQPIIVTQPQSQTNVIGSTVTLSVEAQGTPPLFYQWRRSASPVDKRMPTCTNLVPARIGLDTDWGSPS